MGYSPRRNFQRVKDKLATEPVLAYPNFSPGNRFRIECDASDYGISAVLSNNIHGKINPVFYASRLLNETERKASTTEKELTALIYGLKQYESIITGRSFDLITEVWYGFVI